MAIQMRRGANSDFNPSKMLPGEIAVTTDGTRKVYAAFKANDVKELASKEDVQGLINGFTSVVDREIAEAEQRIESKAETVLGTIPDEYEVVSQKAEEAVRTKADAIVCSVSGINPIAKDSSDDYLRNLKLYGKTTQGDNPSTSNPQPLESVGKWGNLCDLPNVNETTVSGITWSCKNGVITAKGTSNNTVSSIEANISYSMPIKKGTYFISGSKSPIYVYVSIRKADNSTEFPQNNTFTLDGTEKEAVVYAQMAKGVTVDTTVYPMLNEGTTALPYRPYTGQKEVESAVLNKNLLPYPYYSGDIFKDSGITYEVASDNSINVNGTYTSVASSLNYYLAETNELTLEPNTTYIINGVPNTANNIYFVVGDGGSGTPYKNGNEVTFTTNNEGKFGYCLLQIPVGATVTNVVIKPMIRKVEITDGTYIPYSKQSHSSLVGDGLKGIPVTDASLATYTDENGQMWCSDYVDCERGVLVQRISRFIVSSRSNITMQVTNNDIIPYFKIFVSNNMKLNDSVNSLTGALCNRLKEKTLGRIWADSEPAFAVSDTENTIRVRFREDITNVDKLKALLDEWETEGKPLTFEIILKTPIETPLSADEIASYKALHSNYKVTSMMNDCDAFMEVQYNADMKTWINNAIDSRITKTLAQYISKEE